MLNSNNLCVFEGRMVSDPKMGTVNWNTKEGPKSMTKAEFTLAVDKKMTSQQKKADQDAGKPTADFPRFTVIGPKADFVGNYLGKGKACKVVGSFETTSWTDGQGQKQYGWQFAVEDISFTVSDAGAGAGGNNNNNNNDNNGNYGNNNSFGGNNNFTPVDDGDMPF